MINFDLTLIQTINKIDKERYFMNIMVFDISTKLNKEKIIKSPFIICPICKEPSKFEIKNHKVKIYNCKNGHINDNILLNEIDNIQLIDESKIFCHQCKKINKCKTYNNLMYLCNNCNMNLCPLCKSNHDENHQIINYDDRFYFCNEHNKEYYSYCETCNKDICILCEKEHKGHNIISYSTIIPEDKIFETIKSVNNSLLVSLKQRLK